MTSTHHESKYTIQIPLCNERYKKHVIYILINVRYIYLYTHNIKQFNRIYIYLILEDIYIYIEYYIYYIVELMSGVINNIKRYMFMFIHLLWFVVVVVVVVIVVCQAKKHIYIYMIYYLDM